MHRTFVGAAVVAAALLTSSCSAISDQLSGSEVTSAEPEDLPEPILATRQWGVVDGLLSVVVQNTSERTLRYADGVILARTDDNQLVVASVEADESCCGIIDLRPGQEYGFYLDVGSSAADISRVEVSYRNVSWAPAGEAAPAEPRVRARPVRLEQDAGRAVVLADLVSDGAEPEVIAQAFVTDGAGDFLAVVSGRWTCVADGSRPIRMELFHPLPEDARVDRVVVHRVVDDPTRPAPDCAGQDGSL